MSVQSNRRTRRFNPSTDVLRFQHAPGVYRIRNTLNGKSYVGSGSKSIRKRLAWHRQHLRRGDHYNTHLQRAWQKYGETAFEFTALIYCPAEECLTWEQFYIDAVNAADPERGYNGRANATNCLGTTHPAERSARQSARMKEFFSDPAERAKAGQRTREAWACPQLRAERVAGLRAAAARPGSKMLKGDLLRSPEVQAKKIQALRSDAARAKNSQSLRQKWADPEHHAKMVAAHKLRASAPEERARLSEQVKQHFADPEVRERQAERLRRKWADPEYRAMILKARKNAREAREAVADA